jgi:uncharacterized protein
MKRGCPTWVAVAVAWGVLAGVAVAQVTYPARVGERDFILDEANLLAPVDEQAIRTTAEKLLVERDVPLVVVTIPSLAAYGAGDWSIERYAGSLFNEWGIGTPDVPPNANHGILLLVSAEDRQARIELGAGWGREWDVESLRIMDDMILPAFRDGEYDAGVRVGVEALAQMAAGPTFRVSAGEKGAPSEDAGAGGQGAPDAGGWGQILGCVPWPVLLVVVFMVARMLIGRRSTSSGVRRGAGYGPMMAPILLGGLGSLGGLGGRSSGGGGSVMGSGGRTFGGGFSGRGGATGRW